MKARDGSVAEKAAPYWQKLKLDKDPFVGQSQTIYQVPSWQTHDELLSHLCQYNHAMKLIVGSEGIGKTTFVQYLSIVRQIESKVMLESYKLLAIDVLLTKIEHCLGLKNRLTEPAQLLPILAHEQKYLLIIIDEAHLLSNALLAIFDAWIHANTQGYLQLLLVGQRTLLEQCQLVNPDNLQIIELQPFDLQETKNYLMHRLQQVGLPQTILESDLVKQIFQTSKGVPARINQSARQWFIEQLAMPPSSGLQNLLLQYPYSWLVGSGCLLSGSLFALYLYYTSPITQPVFLPAFIEDESVVESTDFLDDIQAIDNLLSAELSTPETQPIAEAPLAVVADNQTKSVQVQATEPSSIDDSEAVLAVDEHYYTIQLFGVHDLDALKRFVHQHHLESKTYYIQTKLHQKIWYILIYGTYPTRAEAAQALHELPSTLKQSRPWLRPYLNLHILIKNRNDE